MASKIVVIVTLRYNEQDCPQGVHSIVKLNTACDKKQIYFLHKASQKMGPNYFVFFHE